MRMLRRRNRQRFIEIGVGHPGTFPRKFSSADDLARINSI